MKGLHILGEAVNQSPLARIVDLVVMLPTFLILGAVAFVGAPFTNWSPFHGMGEIELFMSVPINTLLCYAILSVARRHASGIAREG